MLPSTTQRLVGVGGGSTLQILHFPEKDSATTLAPRAERIAGANWAAKMSTSGKVFSHPVRVQARTGAPGPHTKPIETDVMGRIAPSFDLGALDGLRALASLGVVAFHALLYWGTLLSLNKGYKVSPRWSWFKKH